MKHPHAYPFLILFLVLYGCLKPRLIEVKTVEVKDITSISATATGEVTSLGEGISEYGHCWSTSSNPTYESNLGKSTLGEAEKTGAYTSYLENLSENTLYYVCAYVVGDNEPSRHGEVLEFKTGQRVGIPTVTTTPVTSYTNSSAIVGGNVTSDGGSAVTERGIYWSTAENPRSTGTKLTISTGTGEYSEELYGLSPGNQYFVEAYAVNSAGTGYGNVESFNTNTIVPTVTTTPVTSYSILAIVGGNVISDGGSAITERGVYWSTSEYPRSTGTKLVIGSGSGSFSEELGGLTPGTKYYVEAYAFNGSETGYGSEIEFTTNTIPAIFQQNSYGGSDADEAHSLIPTSDGGYVLGGVSRSNDIDVSGNHGGPDFWLVKIDENGIIQWQKSFGGSDDDVAYSTIQTADGGYAMAGYTYSNDGDVSENKGDSDIWIVKTTGNGDFQWETSLGGSRYEYASSIIQTSDGGYAVAGKSLSNDGDVSGNHGSEDWWIVKLNSAGEIQWQNSLGGSDTEWPSSIIQTSDNGYIVAGETYSSDGDVSVNLGESDCWIVKLNSNGEMQWQISYGGSNGEGVESIIQTSDGGFAFAGYTTSNDGDVSGYHGYVDMWVARLNYTGSLLWQKSLGGTGRDFSTSIVQTSDNGYAVAGFSASFDGDVTGNHGSEDCWIVKLDYSGVLQWQSSFGGFERDRAQAIIQTLDGGYAFAGYSLSSDGDLSQNNGHYDYWIAILK